MTDLTATPETGTVDAPASMEDVLSAFETGETAAGDTEEAVVAELVEEAEEGDAGEPEADDDDATEATEEAEEAAEEERQAEDGPEPTFKVKVNGQEIEVSQSELLKGYSREQDYTAKTMALAEKSKGLESQLASELQRHLDTFKALDPILSEAEAIDWQKLSQEDPTTYVQLKAAYDQRLKTVTEVEQRIAAARQSEAEATAAETAKAAEAETKKLIEAVPALADTAEMSSFAANAVGYLRGTGYDDGEIAELTDHRALIIVDKARRWDDLQKSRTTLPPKKVIPRPAAAALKTDGTHSSSAPKARFPGKAPRERQLDWAVNQLLDPKG